MSSTTIHDLPNEILMKIFAETDNYTDLVLVCKRWKELIENYHSFKILKFFTKTHNKKEYEAMLKTNRNFKNVKFVLNPEDPLQFDYILALMQKIKPQTSELHILKMPTSDRFHRLLESQKNVSGLKIYCGKSEDKPYEEKAPIKFESLKWLDLQFPNHRHSSMDSFLNYMETPALATIKIRSKKGTFALMDNCMIFANKWSQKALKLIDIEFEVRPNHVLTFFWSPQKLVLVQCYDSFLRHLEDFVNAHAEDFKSLKRFNIYVSTLTDNIYRKIGENATNLEVISTDHKMPVIGFRDTIFPHLKMMKMWAYDPTNEARAVYEFSRSFPNIETLLIYEWISEEVAELLKNSCSHLNHFRYGIYAQEYFSYGEDQWN
jgi:hypothetical protein